MKILDNRNIDTKSLAIFCAIYQEGSVTKAAARVGASQSLISHKLEKLRQAFNDPLFVRAGRNIEATEKAHKLAPEISAIVEHLNQLFSPNDFAPLQCRDTFTLSANDLERAVIAPILTKKILAKAPNATLNFVDTKGDVMGSLRKNRCDVIITPLKPVDCLDIFQHSAFELEYACFFDRNHISQEEVEKNYLNLNHARVLFSDNESSTVDEVLAKARLKRRVKVKAPSFTSLAEIAHNTNLVCTVPSVLKHSSFKDFSYCNVPFEVPKLKYRMLWHKSTQHSQKHKWFRELVKDSYIIS